jgi:GNAT superfamily N-acetyltransferase
MVTIRELADDDREWAASRYAAISFAPTPAHAVALVAELAGERVGLGRLVELEPGVIELGGIWTAEARRGRGVARAMVTALLARARGPLWCVPFEHLVELYAGFGFRVVPPPWPAAVATKVDRCAADRLPPVEVMMRA